MTPEQITANHRSRLAYVYIRQSCQHQVIHHQESQLRQRGLVHRAHGLGWPQERIILVDEDLGQSAAQSQERSGFQKMVARAALGKVGIILALEVSRLSRGNRDWYHLLDICAVTWTLLADAEGLYDPRAYNDRLLLGLKGTMSEAELHLMKQRLVEALRAKARRGELCFRLPPGYLWDEAGRMVKDPDEQVRSSINLVFERFAKLGTIHQVHLSLVEEGFRLPTLNGPGHELRWVIPSYDYLQRILENPLYAGAYTYGKRQVEQTLDSSQRPRKRLRKRPLKDWHVLIYDHHEEYISWEMFERNQRQIASNTQGKASVGAPREGASLLQGLVLCGVCGRRMKVRYFRRGRLIRYECLSQRRQLGAPVCQSLGAVRLERAVERLVLDVLEPLGVEAMIEASAAYVRAGEEEQRYLRQKVERARYEVDLARRQYDLVDPANRLVAHELEHRWEKTLLELEAVEAETEEPLKALERPLTEEDKQRLRRYAQDLPSLWWAPTTRVQERKRIIRCLIDNVVVSSPGDGLKAEVHWIGGEVTTVEVKRARSGIHRYVTEQEVVDLVRELAKEFSDVETARILHCKGLKSSKGNSFTRHRIACLRRTYGIEKGPSLPKGGDGIYSAQRAAGLLGVCHSTIIRWVEAGLLRGAQKTKGASWRVQLTEEDRKRLMTADAPADWLTLKAAASRLGVSQQTVLQRLKDGQIEGVRVRTGRKVTWRIRLTAASCDDQPSLFS